MWANWCQNWFAKSAAMWMSRAQACSPFSHSKSNKSNTFSFWSDPTFPSSWKQSSLALFVSNTKISRFSFFLWDRIPTLVKCLSIAVVSSDTLYAVYCWICYSIHITASSITGHFLLLCYFLPMCFSPSSFPCSLPTNWQAELEALRV